MYGYYEEEFSRRGPGCGEGHRERHREHHGGRGFFRRFGPEWGFMARFGRAARVLASGDLQLIILLLLAEKPRHGYDIIKALEEQSSGVYAPSPGMVYPALTYLEEMGYATSEAEGTKKLYRITDAGSEYLAKNRGSAEETLEQLSRFGRKMARFRDQFAEEQEDRGESEGGVKTEWQQTRADFRQVRHDLREALHEKFEGSTEERKRIITILRKAVDEIRGK